MILQNKKKIVLLHYFTWVFIGKLKPACIITEWFGKTSASEIFLALFAFYCVILFLRHCLDYSLIPRYKSTVLAFPPPH